MNNDKCDNIITGDEFSNEIYQISKPNNVSRRIQFTRLMLTQRKINK